MLNNQLVGEYHPFANNQETIRLCLRMPTEEITHHWSRCGLIANFSAAYIGMGCSPEINITNSLSYIINELLENAVKYSFDKAQPIEIFLLHKLDSVIIEVSNIITQGQYQKMVPEAEELLDIKDVCAKYFEIIVSNSKNMNKSGLGLLTLINFYKVKISFSFTQLEENSELYKLAVQIKADIKEL